MKKRIALIVLAVLLVVIAATAKYHIKTDDGDSPLGKYLDIYASITWGQYRYGADLHVTGCEFGVIVSKHLRTDYINFVVSRHLICGPLLILSEPLRVVWER